MNVFKSDEVIWWAAIFRRGRRGGEGERRREGRRRDGGEGRGGGGVGADIVLII